MREAAGNVRREETLKRQLLCVCVCVRVCSTGYRGGKRKQCVHVSENCRPPRPSLSLSLSQTHTHTYTHTHTHTLTHSRAARTHTHNALRTVWSRLRRSARTFTSATTASYQGGEALHIYILRVFTQFRDTHIVHYQQYSHSVSRYSHCTLPTVFTFSFAILTFTLPTK